MDNKHALPVRSRHAAGFGISLAVHAMLLAVWQLSRPAPHADDATPAAMVLRLLPSPAPEAPPASTHAAQDLARDPAPAPAPHAVASAKPNAAAAPAIAPAPAAPAPEPEQGAAEPAQAPTNEAPAPPPAGSMLERARAAAGGIDRTLREERPVRGIVAPVVTPHMKLQKGLARAAELAPTKWYEAPKVEAVLDPGSYDRRRYRVVGPNGAYCVTYESNHAPDGLDTMRDGIKPKKTTCDPDWAPPAAQKWN